MRPLLPILLLLPLMVVAVYFFRVVFRYPHVRRMAFRESAASKTTALLTILGLAVGTSLITIVVSIEFMLKTGTESQLRQHFGQIEYEVPAIRQPEPTRYYYSQAEIDRMLQAVSEPDDLLPIVSYTVSVSATPEADPAGDRVMPNVLVIGLDPAQAAPWLSARQRPEWPDPLPADGMILSSPVAERLGVRTGDYTDVVDLQNRSHRFRVAKVLPEDGLTGYPGVQQASATVIVGLQSARSLFELPDKAYTTVLGEGPPPGGTWQAAAVRSEAAARMFDWTRTASYVFLFISLNAVAMSMILTFNLLKMMSEERRLGLGILRTVGFGRADLKRIMRVEGLIYAAAACLPGSAAGLILAQWLIRRIDLLGSGQRGLAGQLDWTVAAQAALIGGSLSLAFAAVCIWIVSARTFSASRMRASRPGSEVAGERRKDHPVSVHALVSWIVLAALLGFVTISQFPQVRQGWFRQANILLLPVALFMLTPVISYAGIRWIEGLGYAGLRLLRPLPRVYAMLHLALKQLVAERVRGGLSIALFCAVSGFVSMAIVMSGYVQSIMGQTDPRDAIGGYDAYAEDIRMIDSGRFGNLLASAGYPQGEAPVSAAIVQLPWSESGSYAYMVNGVDEAYASTTRIPVKATGGRSATAAELWQELAENPDTVIVSTGALEFLQMAKWEAKDGHLLFSMNGHKLSKKIIGIVDEKESYYPFMKGVWMNAEETRRIGEGFKTMHSMLFLRFPTPELAAQWQTKTEWALAKGNIYPLNSASESETGYYRDIGTMLGMFRQFNLLAMGIGMAGLALVIFRSAKRRRSQLGALRAIGIPPGTLMIYVWVEGSVTGIFGTLLGFTSGGYLSYTVCLSQVQEGANIAGFGFPVAPSLVFFGTIAALIAVVTLAAAWSVYRVSPVRSAKYLIS
ncbi:ABC transporter permease [Cohnella candidum]|uniref:ABC transporter permease n=1 Tax=Cohnella candidum TaxID=2674991 RepID=A0A3G3K230_9BACL|nr:ABC transporter permease [Cohnella candidum]AYQ74528.1 ABC transporter permease [Cohnella candidum]